MKRIHAAAAALVVLLLATTWLASDRGHRREPPAADPTGRAGDPPAPVEDPPRHPHPPAAPGAPIEVTPYRPDRQIEGPVEIEVVTPEDIPIAGARGYWAPRRSRSLRPKEAGGAASDATGRLTLPWKTTDDRIVVSHRRYRSATLDGGAPGGRYRVVLEPGSHYRGRYTTRAGEPLSGVTVRLSPAFASYGDVDPETADLLPGPDESVSVRVGRSDGTGSLEIGGLSARDHSITVMHPHFVPLEIGPQRRIHLDADVEDEITFAPVHAAVANLSAGRSEILQTRSQMNIEDGTAGPEVSDDSHSLELITERLRKRFQARICIAKVLPVAAEPGARPGGPAIQWVEVFLSDRGPVRVGVELRPLDQVVAPETIVLQPGELVVADTGTLLATVEQPDGTILDVDSLYLRPPSDQDFMSMVIKPGHEVRVPAGDYELGLNVSSESAWLLEPRSALRVDAGRHNRVALKLKERLVPVTFDVQAPFDDLPIIGTFRLSDGQRSGSLGASGGLRYLPEGSWSLDWNLTGFREGSRSFTVDSKEAKGSPIQVLVPVELR